MNLQGAESRDGGTFEDVRVRVPTQQVSGGIKSPRHFVRIWGKKYSLKCRKKVFNGPFSNHNSICFIAKFHTFLHFIACTVWQHTHTEDWKTQITFVEGPTLRVQGSYWLWSDKNFASVWCGTWEHSWTTQLLGILLGFKVLFYNKLWGYEFHQELCAL